MAKSAVGLDRRLWTRLLMLLALAAVLLPDFIAWDNVDRWASYGFLTVIVSVSPFSGMLWAIRAFPANDFSTLAYALKLLMLALLLSSFLGSGKRSLGHLKAAFLLLTASFLTYNANVILSAFLSLWFPTPVLSDPWFGPMAWVFGSLAPGKGRVTLVTPLAVALALSLAGAFKAARPLSLLPQNEAGAPIKTSGRRFRTSDIVAATGLTGYAMLMLEVPRFFYDSVISQVLIHGFAGYFALYAIFRISQALGDEKAEFALHALYGSKGRSRAAALLLSVSMLAAAGSYLTYSLHMTFLFNAGFMLALAVPLLSVTILNKLPTF